MPPLSSGATQRSVHVLSMFSLNIGACSQDLMGQGKVCGSGICCRNRNSINYLKGTEGYFRALRVDETVGRAGGVALGFASPSSSCVWWGSIYLHPSEGDGSQEPPQQHCCHAGTAPAHPSCCSKPPHFFDPVARRKCLPPLCLQNPSTGACTLLASQGGFRRQQLGAAVA